MSTEDYVATGIALVAGLALMAAGVMALTRHEVPVPRQRSEHWKNWGLTQLFFGLFFVVEAGVRVVTSNSAVVLVLTLAGFVPGVAAMVLMLRSRRA
jgi:hypothetical protein